MEKTRVLVVDDSVLMRTTISHVLASDPDLEVAGVAANGRIALAKMAQLRPHVVTLDFEMPEMDGLQTLAELQAGYPNVPVIMLSALTLKGAAETLEALARGAADYVGKPKGGDPASALGVLASELIPKIKIHAARARPRPVIAAPSVRPVGTARRQRGPRLATAVCIGTSTGGPNALAAVVQGLPAGLNAPVLIVQHMPPTFTRMLAERLSAQSPIPVREGAEGMRVEPGQGYLAPGGFHMEVRRDGCVAAKAAGGEVLVQDEASCVVWGMPRAVHEAGLEDAVIPLCEMGKEIAARVRPCPAPPPREGTLVR
ncbi:MAG: response regulator [Bryobacterales bacterium]|nr:response regulator [Bryobacterales bacterium]